MEDSIINLVANIPGVGEKRAKGLLSHFGSIEKIVHASKEELEAVENIGPKTAETINKLLHENIKT
jgi:ERCC4-type nuclease